MNLEDMQNVWSEMTMKIEKQEHLTNQLIMEMTQQKFKNKIGAINKYESGGAIICFIAALFVIINIDKLDTWYLLASGIFIVGYLIIIPFLVLRSIMKMKQIDIAGNNYRQSLIDFVRRKKHFMLLQKTAVFTNVLLIIFILPVLSKIVNNKDLFLESGNIWFWYILGMLLFLIPFSIWGYKSYKKITSSAKNLLEELEANG